MKVYGSKFYSCQEEYEAAGREKLSEVIIECNITELKNLANYLNEELASMTSYLNETKDESENTVGKKEYFFPHFRDWDKQWKIGTPDFILAVSATR